MISNFGRLILIAFILLLYSCKGSEGIDSLIDSSKNENQIIPFLAAAPSVGNFDSVSINESNTQSFKITNISNLPATINLVSLIGSAFSLTQNTCFGKTLVSGTGECSIEVSFSPNLAGNHSGSVTITLDTGNSLAISLSGKGVVQTPALTSNPSSAAFGTVSIGSSSSLPLTITNNSGLIANVTSASLTGSAFSVTSNTCNAASIPSGGSCAIVINFSPASATAYAETLSVPFTGPTGTSYTASVALTGLGAAAVAPPTLAASPSTKDFGNVATNATTTQTFTITNTSGVSALTQTGSISGSGYTITTSTCNGVTISAGGTCSFTVRFAPTTQATTSGTYSIPYTPSSGGTTYTLSTSLAGTGVAPSVSFAFNGFNLGVASHTLNLTATGVTLTWAAPTSGSASYFKVFKTVSGTTTATSALPSYTTSYNVSSLVPNTTYTFKVNAYDSLDVSDGNSNTIDVTTLNVTGADFNGWSDVVATGSVYTDIGAVSSTLLSVTNLTSDTARVKIAWENFTFVPASAVATGYNIYRSITSGTGYSLHGTTTSSTYTDETVLESTTYFYKVLPTISSSEIATSVSSDQEIEVFVPATNMALVHRWIANREVCVNLLGKSWPSNIDRTNNYRCSYNWGSGFAPQISLADKSYWDLKYSLVIDRWENGCKISTTGPQYGLDAWPSSGVGSNGDVYNYRSSNSSDWASVSIGCAIKKSGSWYSVSNAGTTSSDRNQMTTNNPGYPVQNFNQAHAYNACQQRSLPVAGNLRLLRLHEKIISAAWSGVFVNPNAALLSFIQAGSDHSTYGSCNVNYGNGVSQSSPVFFSTPNYKLMISGSQPTRNCKSRYEIYDLVGNMKEWTSENFVNCLTTDACQASASSLDPGGIYLENFIFNGSQGVSVTNGTETWVSSLGNTTSVIPMFGLPTPVASSTLGSRVLGSIVSSDAIFKFINPHVSTLGVSFDGGGAYVTGYSGGDGTGRFSWRLVNPTSYGAHPHSNDQGFRCVGTVGP